MFLTPSELKQLTGYAQRTRQVAQLRRMGIAFFVNAAGQPVVPRSTIDGGKPTTQPNTWEPSWGAARP